uniref:Phosphorylated adapter RNA export protein n=1 Tax=Cyprinus carpio TaxID=7962 RepID=A0A8C1VH31_CYPCA
FFMLTPIPITTGPSLSSASVSGYRSLKNTDSSDSGSASEDEAVPWRQKRLRSSSAPSGRRVNNIWGSVVQEQSQESVAAELGIMGMEGSVSMSSRQSETYNYVLARKMMEKEREEEQEGLRSALDGELEGYMQQKSCLKRKRPAKERLGPRAEMDLRGRYQLREDDSDERVVDEIAHRSGKTHIFFKRKKRITGSKKRKEAKLIFVCLSFLQDGSRRRTPGGVYLNLLKNTPSISDGQVKEIFHEENQKEYNNKRAAKKRRKRIVSKKMKQAINTLNLEEDDDVSRETFASDTEEALGSLEEAPPESAPEGPPEAALGTEDNPVVYNSTDLEVF